MRRGLAMVAAVTLLTVTTGVMAGGLRSEGVAAAAPAAAGKCSNASLNGAYGIKFDGTSKGLGRFASVSVWTFDGKGGFAAAETFSSDVTGPKTRSMAGTYTVGGDCRFGLFFPSDLANEHQALGACVLVDNGKELYCLDVEEGWVATGIGKKI